MKAVAFASSQGHVLRGILHPPSLVDGSSGDIAAILLPGLAGTRVGPHRILYDIASTLSSKGLLCLRCDFSGSGYSGGTSKTLSFGDYLRDVQDMMDYLRIEFQIKQFLLIGICRGAKVAISAALGDCRIQHLILLSCAPLQEPSNQRKISRRRYYHLQKYLGILVSFQWIPRLIAGDIHIGQIWSTIFQPVRISTINRVDFCPNEADFGRISARMLFIYGENDPDRADSVRYYQRRFPKAEEFLRIETIANADAGFYSVPSHRMVLGKVEQWWGEQKP